MKDGVSATNETLQLVAAMIYYAEGNYEDALRVVFQSSSLEGKAMLIQIYIKINRLDLADKELKAMQKIDEDATITQLASGWVNLSAGGERINEALLTFQDLIDKNSATPKLLNGLALCHMTSKRFPEAERLLLQALEKNNQDVDTLQNLIVCYEHQGKPELISKQINQLKIIAPKHAWLQSMQTVEEEFDRISQSFTPDVRA